MEERYNFNCVHSKIQNKSAIGPFCTKCGCIFFPQETFGIKPHNGKYQIEISPGNVYHQLRKEYENEILESSYMKSGVVPSEYLMKRNSIIKKMNIFITKLKFHEMSLHLAIFLMDFINGNFNNNDKCFAKPEHVAVGSLILSVKYNELDPTIPDLTYFQILFDDHFFSMDQVRSFEIFCIKKINYKLNYILPSHFLMIFLLNGIIFSSDFSVREKLDSELIRYSRAYAFANEILKFTYEDIKYQDYSYLHIACSCVALAREIVKVGHNWNEILENVYEIRYEDFSQCFGFVKANYFKVRDTMNGACLYIKHESSHNDSSSSSRDYKTIGFGMKLNINNLKKDRRSKTKSQDINNSICLLQEYTITNRTKEPQNEDENENRLNNAATINACETIMHESNFKKYTRKMKINSSRCSDVTPTKIHQKSISLIPKVNKNTPPKFFKPDTFSRNFTKFAVKKIHTKSANTSLYTSQCKEEVKPLNILSNNASNFKNLGVHYELFTERKKKTKSFLQAYQLNKNKTLNTSQASMKTNIFTLIKKQKIEDQAKRSATIQAFSTINSQQNNQNVKDTNRSNLLSIKEELSSLKMSHLISHKIIKKLSTMHLKNPSCAFSDVNKIYKQEIQDLSKSKQGGNNSIAISTMENSRNSQVSTRKKERSLETKGKRLFEKMKEFKLEIKEIKEIKPKPKPKQVPISEIPVRKIINISRLKKKKDISQCLAKSHILGFQNK